MKTIRLLVSAGALVIGALAPAIARAHPLSSNGAVAHLMSALSHDKVFNTACVSGLITGQTQWTIEVTLYEKHDANCGGDPETSPRLASFKVDQRTHKIEWYDTAEGSYRAYRILKAPRK